MTFPIIESLESAEDWQKAFFESEIYVRDLEAKVSVWGFGSHRSMTVVQLGNALKIGAACERFSFDCPPNIEGGLWSLIRAVGFSLAHLLDILASAGGDPAKLDLDGVSVYAGSEPGIRVFSPFQLGRLKPLDREPKKWTVKHAIRAIANGQFDSLRCRGQYTDDYAFDASRNYGEGEIEAYLPFIRKIVESPSGWRVYDDGRGVVSLCCHHFDNNEIKVNLEASRAA
jgi:hypothetical protein